MTEDFTIKCVAIGDGCVGKTTLIQRLGDKPFQESYVATIFDDFYTKISYEGRMYNVNLIDTAGQEENEQLRVPHYSNANVILVCFSVENATSFRNVTEQWLPEVRRYTEQASIILVGTKSDLRSDAETIDRMLISQDNFVNSNAAIMLAKRYNARYIECSSKNSDNISRLKNVIMDVSLFQRPNSSGVSYCMSNTWNLIRRVLCCRSL